MNEIQTFVTKTNKLLSQLDENHATPHADEFLTHILTKYPESTYWLTTHNWRGENRAIEVLSHALKPETVELLKQVKTTEWGELKIDAINFEEDFLWFDDDLWPDELKVLEQNNATGRMVMIDLNKDTEILKKLIEVV